MTKTVLNFVFVIFNLFGIWCLVLGISVNLLGSENYKYNVKMSILLVFA